MFSWLVKNNTLFCICQSLFIHSLNPLLNVEFMRFVKGSGMLDLNKKVALLSGKATLISDEILKDFSPSIQMG